jgi:hypothetical protein
LASLGSNLDGGGWTSWSIAWLSLEFSGAIAAVLMLLLQTICNNRDLREAGPTEKKPFLCPSRERSTRPPNTRHRPQPKEQLDCCCRTCRLGNAVRTLYRERSSGGSHGASFF